MEQSTKFKCTGNCLNCLPAQRAYCAAQHSYSNMKVLDKLMEEIVAVRAEITALRSSNDVIFNPNAQIGDGAEE